MNNCKLYEIITIILSYMSTKTSTSEDRLFIDKYRPQTFNDVNFNIEVAKKLKACAQTNDIPHLIIKGPKGCGKNTFANLYIKAKYNKESIRIRQQKLEIKHASKTIELQLLHSNYHYQIDPSVHGVYDRLIIQGFIKDILQAKPICDIPYHIIVIENADHLTLEAQQSLRRTLEKHIDNCRFIFIINQESTLIEPLMSRCIQLRLSAPNYDQIELILQNICKKENITYQPSQLKQIASYSQRNLNNAINLLQYINIYSPDLLGKNETIDFRTIVEIDNYLYDIVDTLFNKKSPKTILLLRTKLFDLLVHCVEPIDILKKLFHIIFNQFESKSFSDKSKHQLVQILSKYENTLKQGSKPIYHLEGFIVSVLSLLQGLPIN